MQRPFTPELTATLWLLVLAAPAQTTRERRGGGGSSGEGEWGQRTCCSESEGSCFQRVGPAREPSQHPPAPTQPYGNHAQGVPGGTVTPRSHLGPWDLLEGSGGSQAPPHPEALGPQETLGWRRWEGEDPSQDAPPKPRPPPPSPARPHSPSSNLHPAQTSHPVPD